MMAPRPTDPFSKQESAGREEDALPRANFEPMQMPDGRSLLLELPQELQDKIYDKVIEDCIVWVSPAGLVADTPLIRVKVPPLDERISQHANE